MHTKISESNPSQLITQTTCIFLTCFQRKSNGDYVEIIRQKSNWPVQPLAVCVYQINHFLLHKTAAHSKCLEVSWYPCQVLFNSLVGSTLKQA